MRCVFFLNLILVGQLVGQDMRQARQLIATLSGEHFWGRGYTHEGMSKAARFLELEFKSYGLMPLTAQGYLQPFTYPVNTFPGKTEVIINGASLRPGIDFILSPESRGARTDGVLRQKDSVHFIDDANLVEVILQKKLTGSVSTRVGAYTTILANRKSIEEKPESYQVNIENRFISKFKASNVCGMVKGTTNPDSLVVISAHYDHLGGMGSDIFFPGANDNASGVALLLSLAKHYANRPASYSMVFICFGGEEAGLLGSKYFSENSLVPLKQVRFLINLDLTGTGDEGIAVVNASVFKNEFALLNDINNQEHYFTKIKSRGKAANSDHYWFSERGVPSFFIYTLGGIQAYHDIDDRPETLPLTEFEDLFRLLVEFNKRLIK